MLIYPFSWDEISNTTFQSKDNTNWVPQGIGTLFNDQSHYESLLLTNYNLGSIESPHNSVHLLIGGLGDMVSKFKLVTTLQVLLNNFVILGE